MTRPTCATCRWWGGGDATAEIRYGDCRVNPPSLGEAAAMGEVRAIWAVTAATEWCGKHAHAPSGPAPTPGEVQARNDGVIAERERILEMMRGDHPRPCGCVYCICGDTGKAQRVTLWDARVAWANRIARAPAPEEPADG